MYAALKTEADYDYQTLRQPRDVMVSVQLNAQGQLLLVHTAPFNVTPLWVRYYNTARMLEVLFEDGYAWPVDFEISDSLHSHINRSAKINLVWAENNNVVEAWETILLNDTDKVTETKMTSHATVLSLDPNAGYTAGRLDDREANARTKTKFTATVGTPNAKVTISMGRKPAAALAHKLDRKLNFNPPA